MTKKKTMIIVIVFIAIASLLYFILEYQRKTIRLTEAASIHSIIDASMAMPDKGLVIASGHIKADKPPIIEGFDIKNDDALAIILKVEMFQTEIHRLFLGFGRGEGFEYRKSKGWCDRKLIDNWDSECKGINFTEYESEVYFGSNYLFRDSFQLDQAIIVKNINELCKTTTSVLIWNKYKLNLNLSYKEPQTSNYNYYQTELLDFTPPSILNMKIFKQYKWTDRIYEEKDYFINNE